MHKVVYCYKIAPEAGMARDENGENTAVFAKLELEMKHLPDEATQAEIHEVMRDRVADIAQIPVEFVTKISIDEYEAEHDEDGEDE